MADGGADEARFSDARTAEILRAAAEEEVRGGALAPVGGRSLEELVAIAREAGIDPDAVRRAARLRAAPPDPVQRVFLGTPSVPRVTARFPGALPAERVALAREAVEHALGHRGDVEAGATGFLWREDHGVGRTYVRVHADGAVTSVEVEADRKGHLLALMVVLATVMAILLQPVGGFSGLAALVGPLLGVALPLAAVLLGTRALWPRLMRPVIRREEATAMALGALLVPTESDAGGSESLPPADPQGPPSSSDDEESGGSGSAKR